MPKDCFASAPRLKKMEVGWNIYVPSGEKSGGIKPRKRPKNVSVDPKMSHDFNRSQLHPLISALFFLSIRLKHIGEDIFVYPMKEI